MAAYQAPPSLGFSRQEHWSGLPFPFFQLFSIIMLSQDIGHSSLCYTINPSHLSILYMVPRSSEVKASACNAGDLGSIPGLGRSSGEGNGNPLQYSGLKNPMEGGAWQATVHGVTKSQT